MAKKSNPAKVSKILDLAKWFIYLQKNYIKDKKNYIYDQYLHMKDIFQWETMWKSFTNFNKSTVYNITFTMLLNSYRGHESSAAAETILRSMAE